MANFPNPITKDNFPKAWRIVRRRYKLAKVKAAIRRIAKPVGEFLFFPAFLMLAFGAAISFTTPGIQALIGKTPFVAPLWFQLKAILFGSASSTLDYIIRGAAFLYAIPFGAFLAVSLVIAIVYHPKAFSPSGDIVQDAQALWTMARYAQSDAKRKGGDLSGTLSLITGILAALSALFIIFYWLLFPGGENLLAGIGVYQTLRLFAIALILIFAYAPVAFPLNMLMKLVHWCPGAKRMADSAEIFCRGLRRGPVPPMAPMAAPVAAAPVAAAAVAAEAAPAPVQEAPAEVPAAGEVPQEAPAEEAQASDEAPAQTPSETPAE